MRILKGVGDLRFSHLLCALVGRSGLQSGLSVPRNADATRGMGGNLCLVLY
jgi:hypothetical protein